MVNYGVVVQTNVDNWDLPLNQNLKRKILKMKMRMKNKKSKKIKKMLVNL